MAVKTIIVGDEAALSAALKAATGETIIKLRVGDYYKVNIDGINPAAKVTVTSFDLVHKTEIDIMFVKNSSNLTFRDLYFHHVEPTNVATGPQVNVFNSRNISFIHNEFAGNVDNVNTNDASGIQVKSSSRVSILDNKFHDLTFASLMSNSDNLVIAGNDIKKVREGFDFTGVDNVTIDRNIFSKFQPLLTGPRPDHPDGIQFWTTGSTGSTNVEITNNAFLFGNKVPIQGIFIRSELGDAARHSDFLIANNVYQGQSRHGITVNDTDGVRITGNTVVSAPKSGTAQYLDPAINTQNTTGAEVDHNISALMFSLRDTGRIAHNNVDSWDLKTGVGVKHADLFVAVPTGNSVPNAFLAKPGSLADILDAGYTQVDRTGNWVSGSASLAVKYLDMLDIAGNAYQIA